MTDIPNAQGKFVIFLDILGFKSLIENNNIELDNIKKGSGSISEMLGLIFVNRNQLTKVFSNFHSSLQSSIDLSKMSCKLTSITFSDSAFISANTYRDAANTSILLMRNFVRRGVPVRMGIAVGTFETIRFKSDIMADSGEHSSHFLGTGVVRSHEAESCGIKGMRILVHPSLENHPESLNLKQHPSYEEPIILQNCSGNELSNKCSVKFEINYWNYKVTEEIDAWKQFQLMWDRAPKEALSHYDSTAKSINKMRIARGYKPITKFRLKSIPR